MNAAWALTRDAVFSAGCVGTQVIRDRGEKLRDRYSLRTGDYLIADTDNELVAVDIGPTIVTA
jgi:hypothetical protein